MDRLWQLVVGFTHVHHGAITVDEASALGVPPYRLAKWAHVGLLVRPAPNLYTIAGLPDTWHGRVRVATGSGAAWASHRTGAALRGLDGFERATIEVVTQRWRRRKRQAWTVHESRTLRAVDLDEVEGLPTTSAPRTILDLPAVAHPYLVGKALDHACRQDGTMLEAIVQRHVELPLRGRRGGRLMADLLAERLGVDRFTDSHFETAAVRLVRAAGLPGPVLQHQVRDGQFVAYLDLAWPDIRWMVECDSLKHHFGKASHEWDRRRRRRLKRLGWDGVEITYDDVMKRARATGRDLRELYEARRATVARFGVPGAPHRQ
jgi:very-short-patch-repair endonuclease